MNRRSMGHDIRVLRRMVERLDQKQTNESRVAVGGSAAELLGLGNYDCIAALKSKHTLGRDA
jgi:hypothetical protein